MLPPVLALEVAYPSNCCFSLPIFRTGLYAFLLHRLISMQTAMAGGMGMPLHPKAAHPRIGMYAKPAVVCFIRSRSTCF